MSFLEWRRFSFFDQKNNVDGGSIRKALGDTNVVATSCGHGTIVICDSEGVIHLVNKNFQVTTFQGFIMSISLVEQLKAFSVLVAIGEDEIGSGPLVKVWDLEKRDRQDNPMCLKSFKCIPNNKIVPVSALCVSDSSNLMAVGFTNGAIILYRGGNIARDKMLKQTLLRDVSSSKASKPRLNGERRIADEYDPITGLAFKTTSKYSHLFVSTTASVLQYNITVKDKEKEVLLDELTGCAIGCCVLADYLQDCPFMVARKDAIYCYTIDGRGPCYAVDGHKVCLKWFRTYLIIISKSKSLSASPVTVSSTENNEEGSSTENDNYIVTVLDIQNKFIVYSTLFQEVEAVLPAWGSFYILTKGHNLYNFVEKDLQSKLNVLFKRNLYDISIRMAEIQQYDTNSLIDIFKQYGDHLFNKGDYNQAMEQYIKTIGKLEPSYVIRKFLDSQHMDNLMKYLSALHKEGVATGDHTMLLLNCYTKMNQFEKLKQFILTKNRDIDFDINVAVSVCRKSLSDDALLPILAEKYALHEWCIKILIEDQKKYLSALEYIAKLEFTDAHGMIKKFGDTLAVHIPNELTQFLKNLCTGYYPSGTLLIEQNEQQTIHQADPQDFIYLLLDNSSKMVEFLEHVTLFSQKRDPSIYNTLIEHYLQLWHGSNDSSVKAHFEQKIMGVLQNTDVQYDKNMVLILCSMCNFKPGTLFLFEELKLYKQILRYELNFGNYHDVLACCRRFGHQEPSLWVKTLWSAVHSFFPSNILCEILTVIEKEHLLSPLQVIDIMSRSKSLTVKDLKAYLLSTLRSESKLMDEENSLITKYKRETEEIRGHIKRIRNNPILFQGSFCSACKNQLELPSVHFLCQHSFHQYCYQTYVDNENECPACLPNNNKILGVIRSQVQNNNLHEVFHDDLEKKDDTFSLIADYFGRNVFTKISMNADLSKQFRSLEQSSIKKEFTQPLLSETINAVNINKTQARTTEFDNNKGSSTLEANISVPMRDSFIFENESLTSAIENKSTALNQGSTNPFDDDYDERKNPFFDDYAEEKEDGDYDKNLNPFAS